MLVPIFQETSIVLVGSFNPAIFHPSWLANHGLIPTVEAEGAKVAIIHKDVSSFSLEWLRIDVIHEKFIARTNDQSQFNPLRDLVMSIFRILEHTPIKQLGMNRQMHFSLENEETWHKIGHTLAPKEIWNKSLSMPGLTSLSLESKRSDSFKGKINVKLEPSPKAKYAVFIDVNNHIELEDEIKSSVPEILSEHWEKALDKAEKIAITTLEGAM